MNKKIKQIMVVTTALIILLGITLFASGCRNEMDTAKRRMEFFLGEIEWPINMEILHIHSPSGGFGPGRPSLYVVFQLEESQKDFLAENNFEFAVDKRQIPTGGFGLPTSLSHIPYEFRLNWEEEFYWAGKHPAFLVFFPERLWLVAIIIPS